MEYKSIEHKIKPGDVILTCGRGMNWGSLPIKIANFFKRGYRERSWTHAALYIGEGNVVEAFPGGIVKRNFKDAYLNEKFNLLILRHKKASESALKKAIDFCVSTEAKKYDFRALVYFLLYNFIPHGLHFVLENDVIGDCFNVNDSYFCSELVSTGLKEADAYCFEKEPYKIMPMDFNNYLWFDVVDKIEKPERVNFLYHIKAGVFRTFYILAAIIFPFVLIAIGLLIFLLVVLAVKGIIALIILLFGLLVGAKKQKVSDGKDKNTDLRS